MSAGEKASPATKPRPARWESRTAAAFSPASREASTRAVLRASGGVRTYEDIVEVREDPRGRQYLWIGGPLREHRHVPGSDTEAFDQGVVGVTPLVLDLWGRHKQEQAERVVARCDESLGDGEK